MKSGKEQKKILKMARLMCRQHAILRKAFQKSYQRQIWDHSKDEIQRIIIRPLTRQKGLYLVNLSLHLKGLPVNSESRNATHSWGTIQLKELGGKRRNCYFDATTGQLYLETSDPYPHNLLTFQNLN